MKRLLLLCVIAGGVTIVASTAVGRWLTRPQPKVVEAPKSSKSPLHVDPKHLDFGETWESDKFAWALAIENRGTAPVELTHLAGSCTCSALQPLAVTIPAGESRPVKIILDLRPTLADPMDASIRPFAAAVWGHRKAAGGTGEQEQWVVRGRVKRLLRSARAIDFGRVSELAQPIAAKVIPIEAVAPLRRLEVSPFHPDFSVRVWDTEQGYDLAVTPRPGLKPGAYKGAVALRPTALDGKPLPVVELPVSVEVVPDVEAVPAVVVVGCRDVGTEVREVVELRSLSGRRFAVESMTVVGEGLTGLPSPGASPNICAVHVRVTGTGQRAGTIRLRVRPADGSPIELAVPVQWYGVQAN